MVFPVCISSPLLCFLIGSKKHSHHNFDQSDPKLKPTVHSRFPALEATCAHFSEFSLALHDTSLVLIGCCDNFWLSPFL